MDTNEAPPTVTVNEITEAQLEAMALVEMRRFGGLFDSYLAAAWLAADAENKAKLRRTFPEMLNKYRLMALGVAQ